MLCTCPIGPRSRIPLQKKPGQSHHKCGRLQWPQPLLHQPIVWSLSVWVSSSWISSVAGHSSGQRQRRKCRAYLYYWSRLGPRPKMKCHGSCQTQNSDVMVICLDTQFSFFGLLSPVQKGKGDTLLLLFCWVFFKFYSEATIPKIFQNRLILEQVAWEREFPSLEVFRTPQDPVQPAVGEPALAGRLDQMLSSGPFLV